MVPQFWSLQLRDSSGFSPDSLLIPGVKPGTKSDAKIYKIEGSGVKDVKSDFIDWFCLSGYPLWQGIFAVVKFMPINPSAN